MAGDPQLGEGVRRHHGDHPLRGAVPSGHGMARSHRLQAGGHSAGAYDELVSDFTRRRAWLRGKGGRNGCLLVQAPGRRSLVIDPQGYDYARYVALA